MDVMTFLAHHTPLSEDVGVWVDGLVHLRIGGYVGQDDPPLELVTSVRSLVFRGDTILVSRNADSMHIVPGGRCEESETLEETLRREILEETGWTIGAVTRLGFMHFHHLTPKPPGYPYPYPDFFQVVYLAEAEAFVPKAKLTGDYEVESFWIPIEEAKRLDLTSCERLYLDIVVKPKPRTRRGRIHTVAASRKLGCRMH